MEMRYAMARAPHRQAEPPWRDGVGKQPPSTTNREPLVWCLCDRPIRLRRLRTLSSKCTTPIQARASRLLESLRSEKRAKAGFFSSLRFGDFDPCAGSGRLERGLYYPNSLKSCPSISQRTAARLDGIDEGREFGSKWFLGRKLKLIHRALQRLNGRAVRDMPILQHFDLVLCDVVVTHGRGFVANNHHLTDLARCMVACFYRRTYGRAVPAVVFQDNKRFVVHPASEKVIHYRMDSTRRAAQKKIEQVDEMDAVGKGNARIRTRTFEAGELGAQHFDSAKSALRDRITQPKGCRIKSKNVSNLQD